MSWVTVIWSMNASACLTLAIIYFLVWHRNRGSWTHLLFSVTAASTAGYAFCELLMMRAATPRELLSALRWAQVPLFFWLVSLVWFVSVYLSAGRRWLAWAICGMRAVYLPLNFLMPGNVNFLEVTTLRRIQFLGEPVTVLGGVPNPVMLFGQLTVVLILVFVADAGVMAWRRGDRRKALMVGGSVEFFLLAGLATSAPVTWGYLQAPIVISFMYLGVVAVMAYELTRDVLRASELVHQLQVSEAGLRESEARMSLAVDAGDFGIWIQDLTQNEIWASDKWRELYGFTPSEPVEFDAIQKRLHTDDRQVLLQAHRAAMAASGEGRFQTEYRVVLPDGATRWISSRGRVERDGSDRSILVRGASRDVTARKRVELALHDLTGRLLSAQEEERRRIARELHDNLSQQMAALAIGISQAVRKIGDTSEPVARSMRDLGQRAAEISDEIHSLSHRLHSSKLATLGLVEALRGHCQEVTTHGVNVRFDHDSVPRSLPHEVEISLFRVVQEGLNNVVKHSGASEADVTLRATGEALVLTITDRGLGFHEVPAASRDGLGLASMRERLRLIHGEFVVRSQPGQGTTLVATVSIRPIPT